MTLFTPHNSKNYSIKVEIQFSQLWQLYGRYCIHIFNKRIHTHPYKTKNKNSEWHHNKDRTEYISSANKKKACDAKATAFIASKTAALIRMYTCFRTKNKKWEKYVYTHCTHSLPTEMRWKCVYVLNSVSVACRARSILLHYHLKR